MRDCPEGKIYNPKTNRCIKATGTTAKSIIKRSPGKCPEGKVYNPKTERCISATGITAKNLLNEPVYHAFDKQDLTKFLSGKKQPKRSPKKCPPGKVYNPKTERCISATGITAKKHNLSEYDEGDYASVIHSAGDVDETFIKGPYKGMRFSELAQDPYAIDDILNQARPREQTKRFIKYLENMEESILIKQNKKQTSPVKPKPKKRTLKSILYDVYPSLNFDVLAVVYKDQKRIFFYATEFNPYIDGLPEDEILDELEQYKDKIESLYLIDLVNFKWTNVQRIEFLLKNKLQYVEYKIWNYAFSELIKNNVRKIRSKRSQENIPLPKVTKLE